MTDKKITKKDYFLMVASEIDGTECTNKEELLDFLDNEIALLDKRAAKKSGPTQTQKDNEKLKEDIEDLLFDKGPKRAGEVAAQGGIPVQKATALLKQLVDEKRVARSTNKKVTLFSIA